MLLVKPVTVSRGFSVVVVEEQERLTNDLHTETRQLFGSSSTSFCLFFKRIMHILSHPTNSAR